MQGLRWSKVKKIDGLDVVIIVCSGPSLQNFNFDLIKDMGYIITVNEAGNYIPFADAWFTLDPWGLQLRQIPKKFNGKLYAAVPDDYATSMAHSHDHRVMANPKVDYLHRIPFHSVTNLTTSDYLNWGLSEDRSCIHTGNSGYGALNLAYHLEPKKIVFLGLDASNGYFYNVTQPTKALSHLPLIFRSCLPQLKEKNIEVINGSPNSRIDCFPRHTLNSTIKKLREWKSQNEFN